MTLEKYAKRLEEFSIKIQAAHDREGPVAYYNRILHANSLRDWPSHCLICGLTRKQHPEGEHRSPFFPGKPSLKSLGDRMFELADYVKAIQGLTDEELAALSAPLSRRFLTLMQQEVGRRLGHFHTRFKVILEDPSIPQWEPMKAKTEVLTLTMTRQTAQEYGLLTCTCGHPENNHFSEGKCARCTCPKFNEKGCPGITVGAPKPVV